MNKKRIIFLSAGIFLGICVVVAVFLFRQRDISYTEPPIAEQEELPYAGYWNLCYDENSRLIGREYLSLWYSEEGEKKFESIYSYDQEGNLISYSYDEISSGEKLGYGEDYSYQYEDGKLCAITIGERTYQVTYGNKNILYIYDDEDLYKFNPIDYVYKAELDRRGRIKKFSYLRGDVKDMDGMELRWMKEFRYDREGNVVQIEETIPVLYDETPRDDEEEVLRIITLKNKYKYGKTGRLQRIECEEVVDYLESKREDRYMHYTEFVYNGDEMTSYTYDEDGELMGKGEYECDTAGKLTKVVKYGSFGTDLTFCNTFGYPISYDPDSILYFISF